MQKVVINVRIHHCAQLIFVKNHITGWFGMRKDFCSFVLGACPLLQEYGNIAYNSERRTNGVELEQRSEKTDLSNIKKADLLKPVLPIISIELPD